MHLPLDRLSELSVQFGVMRKMTQAEVVAILKRMQGSRSLREFAEELQISIAYLSDIYRGTRQPGKKVLEQLGLEKGTETWYSRKSA